MSPQTSAQCWMNRFRKSSIYRFLFDINFGNSHLDSVHEISFWNIFISCLRDLLIYCTKFNINKSFVILLTIMGKNTAWNRLDIITYFVLFLSFRMNRTMGYQNRDSFIAYGTWHNGELNCTEIFIWNIFHKLSPYLSASFRTICLDIDDTSTIANAINSFIVLILSQMWSDCLKQ